VGRGGRIDRAGNQLTGTRGSASRVEGMRPLLLGPPGKEAVDEGIDTRAPIDATARDDEAAVPPLGTTTEPVLEADVRPPPPPEAFLPARPRALSPNRDTGLVFRNEPPGDDATEEVKKVKQSGTQEPSNGPTQPAFTADLRPPLAPGAAVSAPPRTASNRDTGLVFSNQPPRAPDSSGEKR